MRKEKCKYWFTHCFCTFLQPPIGFLEPKLCIHRYDVLILGAILNFLWAQNTQWAMTIFFKEWVNKGKQQGSSFPDGPAWSMAPPAAIILVHSELPVRVPVIPVQVYSFHMLLASFGCSRGARVHLSSQVPPQSQQQPFWPTAAASQCWLQLLTHHHPEPRWLRLSCQS